MVPAFSEVTQIWNRVAGITTLKYCWLEDKEKGGGKSIQSRLRCSWEIYLKNLWPTLENFSRLCDKAPGRRFRVWKEQNSSCQSNALKSSSRHFRSVTTFHQCLPPKCAPASTPKPVPVNFSKFSDLCGQSSHLKRSSSSTLHNA